MSSQFQKQITEYILKKQNESGISNHLRAHFITLVAENYLSIKQPSFQNQRIERRQSRFENASKIAQAIVLHYFRLHNLTYSLRTFGVDCQNIDEEFNYLLEKKKKRRKSKNQNDKPKYDNQKIQEYLMKKINFQTNHFISFLVQAQQLSNIKHSKVRGNKYCLSCVLLSQKNQNEPKNNVISYYHKSRGPLKIHKNINILNSDDSESDSQHRRRRSRRSNLKQSERSPTTELSYFNSYQHYLYKSSDSKLEPIELTFDDEEEDDENYKTNDRLTYKNRQNNISKNRAIKRITTDIIEKTENIIAVTELKKEETTINNKQKHEKEIKSLKIKHAEKNIILSENEDETDNNGHLSSHHSQSENHSEPDSQSRSESERHSRSESESHSHSESESHSQGNQQKKESYTIDDYKSSKGSESERVIDSEQPSFSFMSISGSLSESPYLSGSEFLDKFESEKFENEIDFKFKPKNKNESKIKSDQIQNSENKQSQNKTDQSQNNQIDQFQSNQTDQSQNNQTDQSQNNQIDQSQSNQTDQSQNEQTDQIQNDQTNKNQEPSSQSHSILDSSFDISNLTFSQPDPRFIKKEPSPDSDITIDRIDSTFIENTKSEIEHENHESENEIENEENKSEIETKSEANEKESGTYKSEDEIENSVDNVNEEEEIEIESGVEKNELKENEEDSNEEPITPVINDEFAEDPPPADSNQQGIALTPSTDENNCTDENNDNE